MDGKRMLIACALALALPGMACADTANQNRVRELEQAQARSAIAGDRKALEKVFAEDFVLVNPTGAVTTREDLLQLLTGGAAPYRSATYETQHVRDLGDTIVTIGLETVVMNSGPQAGQQVQRRITHVWHRQGNEWRLRVRHANVVQ